jgi:hypothetical protein
MTLTLRKVAALLRAGKPHRHGDGDGLYLEIHGESAGSWLYRYQSQGKGHWMGLGSASVFSLLEARDRARKAGQLRYDGTDPLQHKRTAKAAQMLATSRVLTFKDVADQFFAAHSGKWTNAKHREQFWASLNAYVIPIIGKLAIGDIDRALVIKVLQQAKGGSTLWNAAPTTANRVRRRIEAVLDYAAAQGLRAGENPARWAKHLDKLLPAPGQIQKTEHHVALPYADIPAFMLELRSYDSIGARALEFLILTAARSGETRLAVWGEIDGRFRQAG